MLSARVAAVTGSNKGIGFHIAQQLVQSGLFGCVLLACRNPANADAAAAKIRQLSGNGVSVECLTLDLAEASSRDEFVAEVTQRYGRLDVLVNNAGTAFKGSDPTPFEEQTKPTLAVNFYGTLALTEALLPLLEAGEDPRIVNVASMAGRLGQLSSPALREEFSSPTLTLGRLRELVGYFESAVEAGTCKSDGWGSSNYGLSKLALIAATKVLAREHPKIKVNGCCPGYCDTDMTSHRGPRPPAEGAKNAVVLAVMPHEKMPTGEFWQNLKPSVW